MSEIGKTLQELVAKELGTCPLRYYNVKMKPFTCSSLKKILTFLFCRVKLISAGKVINSHHILSEQNLQNNQQIMAVILESSENLAENAAYDRVQKAREDAQLLINQKGHNFMEVSEDGFCGQFVFFVYNYQLANVIVFFVLDGRSKRQCRSFTTRRTK